MLKKMNNLQIMIMGISAMDFKSRGLYFKLNKVTFIILFPGWANSYFLHRWLITLIKREISRKKRLKCYNHIKSDLQNL